MLYILQTNRSLRSESKVLERIFYYEVTSDSLSINMVKNLFQFYRTVSYYGITW